MNQTKRPCSEGAEGWLYNPIKVLDHGYVELVDYNGNDKSIADAARISYGNGTRPVSEDETLLRYLRRHAHTSPFEQVGLTFSIKMPLFIVQQILRHRTASINQESLRYSQPSFDYFLPDSPGKQSKSNKQGSEQGLTTAEQAEIRECLAEVTENAQIEYKRLTSEFDLSREIARTILTSNTYTKLVWKMDLHNLMHFLRLRLHLHAQEEIRDFGKAVYQIAQSAFPISMKAFEDYALNAVTFSALELDALRELWNTGKVPEGLFSSKRERQEFEEKAKKLLGGGADEK